MNNIDNTIENIGHKIKYYRNLNKVSLSKLAKEANISKSTLFGLEEGRSNPTISTLINISKTLNIKLTELIGNYSKKSNSVALAPITDTSNKQIYKLSLLANQLFSLDEDIYNDITITVLDGELLYINGKKRILNNHSITLNNNAKLKAGKDGAVAIITISKNSIPNYIEEDIFIDKATTENIETLSYMVQSKQIIRAICSSIYPLEHPQKIKNVQILEIQEKKELHYYFISTFLGLIGGINSILSQLKLKPTKEIVNTLNFIKKTNSQELLSNNDFNNISKNPIVLLIDELINLIQANYKNCKILTDAHKLNTIEYKSGTYILIIDELINNTEQTQNLINTTFLINLYRAIELLIPIKEQELTNEELEFYLKIRESLGKAFYYSKNSYKTLAIKQINKAINTTEIATTHKLMKLYLEALKIVQLSINSKENLKIYSTKTALEQKISDLNLEIVAKQNIHPSIGNSGKYLYLLKCN